MWLGVFMPRVFFDMQFFVSKLHRLLLNKNISLLARQTCTSERQHSNFSFFRFDSRHYGAKTYFLSCQRSKKKKTTTLSGLRNKDEFWPLVQLDRHIASAIPPLGRQHLTSPWLIFKLQVWKKVWKKINMNDFFFSYTVHGTKEGPSKHVRCTQLCNRFTKLASWLNLIPS